MFVVVLFLFVFFFKQKTAYEMRISDWSSDVCSSDLILSSVAAYPMKMANSCQVALSDFLGEQDPLPPEDRPLPRKRISLDALYRDHAPRLLRFFIRRAGRDDATDLVQETFARFAGIDEHGRNEIDRPEEIGGAHVGTPVT